MVCLVPGTLVTECPCSFTDTEDSAADGTLGEWEVIQGEAVLEATVCDLPKDSSCESGIKIVGGCSPELFLVNSLGSASDGVCVDTLPKVSVEI